MKPRLIVQTVFLGIALVAIIWVGSDQWREAQARRNATFNVKPRPAAAVPPAALPVPETPPPARYADVAQKNLFSKDRNPNVIIDPPKVEAPKPMPPLPVVYGVMGLPSGLRALMSEKPGVGSLAVRVGDKVGEFKILALDTENVTFEWNGKEVRRKIEDLADHGTAPGAPAAGPAVVTPPPAQANSGQTNSPPATSQTQNQQANSLNSINASSSSLGVEVGPPGLSQRACKPGDNSPAGTVVEGYKKTLTPTPLGFSRCIWVQQ